MTTRATPADRARPHRALWPLPGSATDYSETILVLLRMAEDSPPVPSYCRRLEVSFPRVATTASGYLKSLTNVGLVECKEGEVRLTSAGRRLLRGSRSVLPELLVARVAGVSDLMTSLSRKPMRIGHLHAQLQERGFAWRTQSQVRYRLRWMEAAGIVERVALSRYPQYALTASGRRLIKKVVHSG